MVQFGQQRVYTALVRRIHHNIPASGMIKYVLSVLDEKPLVSEWWLEMVDWISDYYMSSPGEVLSVALPSVLKMASETKISICPGLTEIPSGLSAHEDQILELLMQSSAISLKDLSKAIGLNRIVPVARTLMDKGLVVLEEQMEEKLKPRFEKYISLSDTFCTETALRELFEHLEKRSPRQVDILTAYITLSGWPNEPLKEVTRKQLLEASGTTSTVLEAMIRKSIFDSSSSEVSRFSEEAALNSAQTISLSLEQERVYNEIKGLLDVNKPILFHGIQLVRRQRLNALLFAVCNNEVYEAGHLGCVIVGRADKRTDIVIAGNVSAWPNILNHSANMPGAPQLFPCGNFILSDGYDLVIPRHVRDVGPVNFFWRNAEFCGQLPN